MNLHEYQAKRLFEQYAIPVPKGVVATDQAQAEQAAGQLGGSGWVVKAQVHAGGRGKAGGVVLVDSPDRVARNPSGCLAAASTPARAVLRACRWRPC